MIECWHTFPLSATEMICREELYVADEKKESHYRLRHRKNKGERSPLSKTCRERTNANMRGHSGAKLLTYVEIDMTHLLHSNPPLPAVAPNVDADAPNANMMHYRIEFGMVMTVEGRNLRFEVRYPKDSDKVCKSAHVSMAPAFAPGTA
jgi:hypothetical protein